MDPKEEEARARYRYLQLKSKAATAPKVEANAAPSKPEGRDYSLFRSEFQSPQLPAGYGGDELLTNKPTGVGGSLVRSAPGTAGALIGGMLGAPAGPLGVVGGSALGGFVGEIGRQNAVQIGEMARGEDVTPARAAIGRAATEGISQGAGAGVGLAAGPVLKAVGRTAVNNPVARAVGGYSKEAAERLMSHADDVVKSMGTTDEMGGKTFEAAKGFKAALRENVELAGEKYRAIINQVIGDNAKYGTGFKLNLQNGVADDAAKVLKESGYGQPGRLADKADAEKFMGFWRRVNSMNSASADDVYWLQRDLNNALGESNSPTLNRHLGKIKESLGKYLEKTVPEIGEANKIYSEALTLADDLGRIDGADDASKAILSRYRAHGSDTRQSILAATKELPAAQESLDRLLNLESAKQFAKGMPDIPRTGFGATAVVGLNQMFNPAAVATGALGVAGVSPLATANTVRGAQAVSRAIPSWAPRAAAAPASSVVGQLLAPAPLSPAYQAVLDAANRR